MPIDDPVTVTDLALLARQTIAAHRCQPGQIRQARCDKCTGDGCQELADAQTYLIDRGWGVR
jgi:hypothetical protein